MTRINPKIVGFSRGTAAERCPTCGLVRDALDPHFFNPTRRAWFECPDPFHSKPTEGDTARRENLADRLHDELLGDTDGLSGTQQEKPEQSGEPHALRPAESDPNHDYWQARAEARLAALIEVRDWARESAASPDFDPPARGAYRSVASKLSEKIDSLPTDGLGGEEK